MTAKSGLVGIKGYFKTYSHETANYVKHFWSSFWALKPNIASKFVQTSIELFQIAVQIS